MDNKVYKNFFINRFLDRLNTGLKEEVVMNRVEDFRALITPIMGDHVNRWPSAIPSLNAWKYGVNPIKTFGEKRPTFQRQHLIEYFQLEDTTFRLTMNNTTVERGHLKVNTLTIEDTIFDGLYFQGVPVTIEVIANHGYKFSHWKETSSKEKNLIINLVSDTTLTAIFIENDDLDYSAITINEVYNADLDTLQGTVDGHEWIELYNSSDEDINLEGLFMTDNEDLTRWMLPLNENSIILANDFLIVYADKDSTHTESLEANFKKLKKDDVVSLTKIIGPDTTELSSLSYI